MEHREWTLENGAAKEHGKGNKRPALRRCSECDMLYEPKHDHCPYCGHEPGAKNIKEVDVELVRFRFNDESPSPFPSTRPGPKATQRQINKEVIATRGNDDQLMAIARKYGYQVGVIWRWKKIYKPVWASINRSVANG